MAIIYFVNWTVFWYENIGVCIDDLVADYTKYFIGSQIEKKTEKKLLKVWKIVFYLTQQKAIWKM